MTFFSRLIGSPGLLDQADLLSNTSSSKSIFFLNLDLFIEILLSKFLISSLLEYLYSLFFLQRKIGLFFFHILNFRNFFTLLIYKKLYILVYFDPFLVDLDVSLFQMILSLAVIPNHFFLPIFFFPFFDKIFHRICVFYFLF